MWVCSAFHSPHIPYLAACRALLPELRISRGVSSLYPDSDWLKTSRLRWGRREGVVWHDQSLHSSWVSCWLWTSVVTLHYFLVSVSVPVKWDRNAYLKLIVARMKIEIGIPSTQEELDKWCLFIMGFIRMSVGTSEATSLSYKSVLPLRFLMRGIRNAFHQTAEARIFLDYPLYHHPNGHRVPVILFPACLLLL